MTYLWCWWETEEKGRVISLALLVSWFLRSYIFISASLSAWVGRYESWSVSSLCNVRGNSGRCAAGASPHPSPTQPREAVAHINQGKLSTLHAVGAGVWDHGDIRWLSHCHGAATSTWCMFCVQQVYLLKYHCKICSSNAQTTDTHPFLSQMLSGRTEWKKNENDFAKNSKNCQSPYKTPCLVPCS